MLTFQTKYSELSAEVTETKSILQNLKYENQNLRDEYDKILSNSTTTSATITTTEKSCHNYISVLQTEIKKYKNVCYFLIYFFLIMLYIAI